MPSRRRLLAAAGTAAAAGLAGCSGGSASGGSDTVDCHTSAVDHGDGDVLDGGAMADVDDGDVHLSVPLSVETVRETGVDRLNVYAGEELAYTIPVSAGDADRMASKVGVSQGQLRYEQYLGERPQHGRYRVVAADGEGRVVNSVTVEFNCFAE